MSTTVKITETYDLKTSVNKIGLIGIHTPSSRQIREMYPGLVKNHRYLKIQSCDIVGACASVLPADPLSVGTSAGDVAPEDMFNPILYKAVSNESFDSLINRIYDASDIATLGSVNKDEISRDPFSIYYGLLAENGKWIHAMPQRGFGMNGLYPLCYQVINTFGNMHDISEHYVVDDYTTDPATQKAIPNLDGVNVPGTSSDVPITSSATDVPLGTTFKGQSVRMPRIPMHYKPESVDTFTPEFYIPKTFVACVIVPPAKLHEFYYRMRVSWTITFEDVCTAMEISSSYVMKTVGQHSYTNEYASAKSVLPTPEDTVDTADVEINKIMSA